MDSILELLSENCTYTPERISAMLDIPREEVEARIEKYKAEGVLLGCRAVIDWDKTETERVSAFIELKVNPHKDRGFDKIAEYISQFTQVQSLYLMSSSGYDLLLTVEGSTMKEIALFVAKKLAPMEGVVSTSTHFVLKKYKYKGVVYKAPAADERENCN